MQNPLDLDVLSRLSGQFLDMLPKVLWTVLLLLLGWLIYRSVLFIAGSLLKLSGINTLSEKLNETDFLSKSSYRIDLRKIILFFVRFLVILILVIAGAEMLNLHAVSEVAAQLITYLPRLFTGIALLILGIVVADLVRNAVQGMLRSFDMSGSKFIGGLAFYTILLIAGIMALNQLGIHTDIITNNVLILFGALLAAFTIALGLGSKDVISRLLLSFYTRKNFETGMKVRVDDIEGVIERIDSINLVLDTGDKKIVFPIKNFTDRNIIILQEKERGESSSL
ncbi:mechanosensitive ion channel family protein [Sinomicrobium soli]|uniref:mechanosensitive ion channel family protein n=1 Tax=Sinomicrobium sp. N-1-3-6 TaxID=2219864 RepID=UPI000DCDF9D8|nr:mechanosensitive ion channel [Sinomicrobium sp. N-1-3-6]RAV29570.1 small-conductance mechanosensitive channel [Sinomicrobium sp. N-1-3-6]